MEQHQRRETDKFSYTLTRWAGLVLSLGAVGGAVLWAGGLFFQTKDNAAVCEEKVQAQIQTVEKAQVESDKTMIEMRTDIKYIRKAIDDLAGR
jgi:hypothetical protein